MVRRCEVCDAHPMTRPRRVLIERRVVSLCEEHARRVREAEVQTIEELRRLFPEPNGRRSRVERRTPLDRRVFPPRPEGRRRGPGRRDTDVE